MNSIIAGLMVAAMCGVAPERAMDFWWENDYFGMRAYGPKDPHVWSGLDVFTKLVPEDVVGEVLHHPDAWGNWHHRTNDKVFDNYTMGASRGVGAVALWGDGEWKTYPDWESYRILTNTADRVEFELVYPAFSAAGRMTYHITMNKDERFFKNTVSFEKKLRKDFRVGPALDVSPSRGHTGSTLEDPKHGILALFEKPQGDEGAAMSAIVLAPEDAKNATILTDAQGCRVLLVNRQRFTYYAGAYTTLRGDVKSDADWFGLVRQWCR